MFNLYKKEKDVIFIVDDCPVIINLIDNYLNNFSDIKIYKFSSGEDCLMNMDLNPSIILLDYDLSGVDRKNKIDGIEVLTEVKMINKDVQVIMVSGHDDSKIIKKCILKGSDGYLLKDDLVLNKVYDKVSNSLKAFRCGQLSKRYKTYSLILLTVCILETLLLSIKLGS